MCIKLGLKTVKIESKVPSDLTKTVFSKENRLVCVSDCEWERRGEEEGVLSLYPHFNVLVYQSLSLGRNPFSFIHVGYNIYYIKNNINILKLYK